MLRYPAHTRKSSARDGEVESMAVQGSLYLVESLFLGAIVLDHVRHDLGVEVGERNGNGAILGWLVKYEPARCGAVGALRLLLLWRLSQFSCRERQQFIHAMLGGEKIVNALLFASFP